MSKKREGRVVEVCEEHLPIIENEVRKFLKKHDIPHLEAILCHSQTISTIMGFLISKGLCEEFVESLNEYPQEVGMGWNFSKALIESAFSSIVEEEHNA